MRRPYKNMRTLLATLILVALLPQGLHASAEMSRKVLALYESKITPDIFHTDIHQRAEMPLNHLGLEVVYRAIEAPLPTAEEMKGVRGILTWFQRIDGVPEQKAYCQWLTGQMDLGRRVVILGQTGVIHFQTRIMEPECLAMMRRLGVDYQGEFSDNPFFFEVTTKDPSLVEFERKLDLSEGLTYQHYHPLSNKLHIYLALKRRDLPESDSAMVFTSPQGGFAYRGYVNFQNREMERVEWRLNPFRFFEEAFGVRGLPRPDITTINGRRIFYSHIDGDGFFNVSHIDRKSLSAEIIYEQILKRYPTLPITASLITGYLDLPRYANEQAMQLYQKILSLPNVQPAAHGYAHPLVWQKQNLALNIPGYQYDPEREIRGSVNQVNQLLETLKIPKKTNLYSWTGDCLLTEEILSHATGLMALNGGDSRFDTRYTSYSYVAPIGILRGSQRQIYTSAPNENIYTNLWKGPFHGYQRVIETFKNTETPVRLKPINIYYHYYSGEHTESVKALTQAYDYALSQEIIPVTTADYVQMAHDFFQVKLIPLSDGARVLQNGSVRTIRFDEENRFVDRARSKGVVGSRHFQKSLYVFLDDSQTHEIRLTNRRQP